MSENSIITRREGIDDQNGAQSSHEGENMQAILSEEQKIFFDNLSPEDQELFVAMAYEVALSGATPSASNEGESVGEELLQKILLQASMGQVDGDGENAEFMAALAQQVDALQQQAENGTSSSIPVDSTVLNDLASSSNPPLVLDLSTQDQGRLEGDAHHHQDEQEVLPNAKEQALFAMYLAHYQREAQLKLLQSAHAPEVTIHQLMQEQPTTASSTVGIEGQLDAETMAALQNSLIVSQEQMLQQLGMQDVEAMNAVMQEALQAALQQNFDQTNSNTIAINNALANNAAPAHGMIDINSINMANVDWENVDFSNVDLSGIDFSSIANMALPPVIDFSAIGNANEFDMNIQHEVPLDEEETAILADGEDVGENGHGDGTRAADEKKKKKSASTRKRKPKEPKPPRVKAAQGPQDCLICNRTFKSRKTLVLHQRSHEAVKPYPCIEPGCASSFAQKSHLDAHKLTHTGERPYKCSICEASYTTPSRRNEHMRSHTRETKYSCEECDMKFRNITNYKNHMSTHLPKEQRPVKKWYCPHCECVYAQRTSLIRHRNKAHPKTDEERNLDKMLRDQKKHDRVTKKTTERISGVLDAEFSEDGGAEMDEEEDIEGKLGNDNMADVDLDHRAAEDADPDVEMAVAYALEMGNA